MLPLAAGREPSKGVDAPTYVRHRPERTLLYLIVEEHFPAPKERRRQHVLHLSDSFYVDAEFLGDSSPVRRGLHHDTPARDHE